MFSSLFNDKPIYVKIFENKIEFKLCDSKNVVITKRAIEPFSSKRLLVGNFNVAEKLIVEGIKEISPNSIFIKSPKTLIHAIDKSEGGLSQVEERTLRELALVAGCRDVVVWCGKHLSDAEVEEIFDSK